LAILLAVALLPLLLGLHSTYHEHSALDPPVEVFTGASHPNLPAHFETSSAQARQRCADCILQLQSTGSLQAAPVLVAQIAAPLAEIFRQWHAPAFAAFVPSAPRAPPSFSPAA
jgi:hypothetical protein